MSRPTDPFDLDLTPELILRAYQAGIFPMAEDETSDDLFWVCPPLRGVMPLDGFKISKSLRKTLHAHPYSIRVDSDFDATIEGCATAGVDRDSTWINPTIRKLYGELFRRGFVHTVEVWDGPALVGGLYGLSMGGAFFGESMFHRKTDASKIAMAHLVERLNAGGYGLLDTQFLTPHLASLGGIEIPREIYEVRLGHALQQNGDFFAWDRLHVPDDLDKARAFIAGGAMAPDWSVAFTIARLCRDETMLARLARDMLEPLLAAALRPDLVALANEIRRSPGLFAALRLVNPEKFDAWHGEAFRHVLAVESAPARD